MSELSTAICSLDNAAAAAILATVGEHRLRPGPGDVTEATPELLQALADAAGGGSGDDAPATRGEPRLAASWRG
jgi:hypothetical protein